MDKNLLVNRFRALMGEVKRKGVDKLMSYIEESSDFYTAPASTKYHLSCESGLLQHSLNVFDCLERKMNMEPFKSVLSGENKNKVDRETIIIVSLLHDICKTSFYATSTRNVKDEKTGQWNKVPYYTVDDHIPYGHGEKSVMMIESFIRLKPVERYAIRWHMGFSEPKEYYQILSSAMNKFPLILALNEADLEASVLMEDVNGNKSIAPPDSSDMQFEEC